MIQTRVSDVVAIAIKRRILVEGLEFVNQDRKQKMRKMLLLVVGHKTERLTDGEWTLIVRKSSQLLHWHKTDIETWSQKSSDSQKTGIFENR